MRLLEKFQRTVSLLLLKGKGNKILCCVILLLNSICYSQTTVNSLSALKPYLNDNNVDVKLAPGTYWITGDDIRDGLFDDEIEIFGRSSKGLLIFEGNNSIYDFTGVTINVDTEVFEAHGSGYQVYEVHTVGNNNVIKNLTLVDVGSVDDFPPGGANSIVMDGEGNRIEGFHVTTKGSFPYGYGDAFGKGGSGNTIGHKKHSACLIRGESNHLKNSTFIHRAYGHCIYMQAASNPIIEGCNVEGEMRSTDDMLAEEGTGSPADDIDFMTTWGYRLPPGYMMSTGEAGIRAYNAGETIINGVEYSRGTSNPTVLNCTIKYMRTGVTIAHASGTKYVEGCVAIGCENGFSLGSGTLINCSADCTYGPVYASTYQNDRDFNAEITVLPAIDPYYNGNKTLAYVGGRGHNITLYGGDSNIPQDYTIKIGGDKNNIRMLNGNLSNQNNFTASDVNLENRTNVPIVIVSGSEENDIITCGEVTDNGSNNTISYSNDCEPLVCNNHDAFSVIEAEDYCEQEGIQTVNANSIVGYVNDGDWLKYEGVNFGNGANSVSALVSSGNIGGNIEIRQGSTTGNLLGILEVENTGSWTTWETVSTNVSSVNGEQDIYLVFSGGDGYLLDVDNFQFSNETLSTNTTTYTEQVSKLLIYPNPVSATTTIQNAAGLILNVYDLNGSVVFTQIIYNESEIINLSGLATGIYFGKVNREKSISAVKLIKK